MLPSPAPGQRIATGTGHRPEHLPADSLEWAHRQVNMCAFWLAEHGYNACLSGLARGFDMWFADACHRAGMDLWVVIPFEEQASIWSADDRQEWKRLRELAQHELVIGSINRLEGDARRRRINQLIAARNQVLVTRGTFLAALWSPDKVDHSGTYQTICKAHRRQPPMHGVHIDPLNRRIVHQLPDITHTTRPAANTNA